MSNNIKCHCGKPLHYSSQKLQREVEAIVRMAGSQYVRVEVEGVTYKVQRHYIALHGIKGELMPTYGFEVIS